MAMGTDGIKRAWLLEVALWLSAIALTTGWDLYGDCPVKLPHGGVHHLPLERVASPSRRNVSRTQGRCLDLIPFFDTRCWLRLRGGFVSDAEVSALEEGPDEPEYAHIDMRATLEEVDSSTYI